MLTKKEMPSRKPRWCKEATKELYNLFDSGKVDPSIDNPSYLKDLYNSSTRFQYICPNKYNFNQNYKQKAREYILEKEKCGARRE